MPEVSVAKAEISILVTRKLPHPLQDFNTNFNLSRQQVPSLTIQDDYHAD